jgi:hypothetical protein
MNSKDFHFFWKIWERCQNDRKIQCCPLDRSPVYVDFEFEENNQLSMSHKIEPQKDFKFRGGKWSSGHPSYGLNREYAESQTTVDQIPGIDVERRFVQANYRK